MGTNCAPLVADLILFCYTGDFTMSLSDDKQVDIIDTFKLLREISEFRTNPKKLHQCQYAFT